MRARTRWSDAAFPAAALAMLACTTPLKSPGEPASDTDVRIVATLNDETITLAELDDWIRDDLFEREMSSKTGRYEVRSQALDRMINERLIERKAASRGYHAAGLIEAEVAALGPISDRQVKEFFEENKDRMESGGELEELSPRIRSYIQSQRPAEVVEAIRQAAAVTVVLEPPRSMVRGTGASRGPADAAVVIVEFSDYQCPYCRRVEPTLNEILARYPDDVRWEYRHFPLPSHSRAKPAAEAAVCAEAQGKFWQYHEKLFSQPGSLDAASLRKYAEEADLNLSQFEACQQAPDTRARVLADLRAGERAGARGTPSFFINGIFLNGARPVEAFEKLIQAELAKASAAP